MNFPQDKRTQKSKHAMQRNQRLSVGGKHPTPEYFYVARGSEFGPAVSGKQAVRVKVLINSLTQLCIVHV